MYIESGVCGLFYGVAEDNKEAIVFKVVDQEVGEGSSITITRKQAIELLENLVKDLDKTNQKKQCFCNFKTCENRLLLSF